jgi:hypothetical protein
MGRTTIHCRRRGRERPPCVTPARRLACYPQNGGAYSPVRTILPPNSLLTGEKYRELRTLVDWSPRETLISRGFRRETSDLSEIETGY